MNVSWALALALAPARGMIMCTITNLVIFYKTYQEREAKSNWLTELKLQLVWWTSHLSLL